MESFWKRFKYYGIGFGIGTLFVIVFFNNRGCSWLPENRVKNTILDRVIVLPENQKDELKKHKLSIGDLNSILNDGKVDFGNSIKNKNPKVYAVTKTFNNKEYTFYYSLIDESFIAELHFTEKNINQVKLTKKGKGDLIAFPKEEDFVYPDSTNKVTCQLVNLGIKNPRQILKSLKKNGQIDFSKTNYYLTPKPEICLIFKSRKGEVAFQSIWYKNKIYISDFNLPFENDCK